MTSLSCALPQWIKELLTENEALLQQLHSDDEHTAADAAPHCSEGAGMCRRSTGLVGPDGWDKVHAMPSVVSVTNVCTLGDCHV